MEKNKVTATDRALSSFAEMMCNQIESISNNWQKPWFTCVGGLHRNMDERAFTGINQFMLTMYASEKGYEFPYWGTFEKISSLNYEKDEDGDRTRRLTDADGNELPFVSVNKGEKSFPVILFTRNIVNKNTRERISYDQYASMNEDEQGKYDIFPSTRVLHEFNLVAQTNIKETRPELYEKLTKKSNIEDTILDDSAKYPAIEKMIFDNLYYCPIEQVYGDDAYYSISKDKIVIPELRQFKDLELFIGNTLHECSHATGAECRIGRLEQYTVGSHEYAKEELVAELSSAFVCSQYGIVKHIKDDSAAYIKNWLYALKKDASFIKTLLLDVQKSATMINDRLNSIQLEIDKGELADYTQFAS